MNRESRIRVNDYPELHVGFPERNDASNPNVEMERIHVDVNTFKISRKTSQELVRELNAPGASNPRSE